MSSNVAMDRRPEFMVGHIYLDGEQVAPFWCDVEMFLSTNKYTPYDIFQMKDEILEKANKSQEIWKEMSDEERDYHERLGREALEVLHENVPMWLPQAFIEGDANHIRVEFNIVNTEINRFIEGVKFHSEFRNRNAKQGLIETLAEINALDDEEDELTEEGADASTA